MLENIPVLLWVMRVFGLYHDPPGENLPWWRRVFNGRNYCFFIVVCLWVNLARYLFVFLDALTNQLPYRTITFFWFLQGALNATTCFHACYSKDHLPRLQEMWKIFLAEAEERKVPLKLSSRGSRKRNIIWLLYAVLFICANMFIYVAGVLDMFSQAEHLLLTIVEPFQLSPELECFFVFVELYVAAAWIFPFCFIILLAGFLQNTVHKYQKYILSDVDLNQGHWPWDDDQVKNGYERKVSIPDILTWRYYHLRICDLVMQLDKDFRLLILGLAVASVPDAALATNSFISIVTRGISLEATQAWLNLYWIVFTVFNTGSVLVVAYGLNDQLQSPVRVLSRLQGVYEENTDDLAFQIHLFMLRLKGTGDPLGFTVGGMAVISKTLMFTILGIYLTFIFFVIEMSS